MNMQCSLILYFMLYEFELGNNTAKAAKNICCVIDEGTVDHSRLNQIVRNFAWVSGISTIRQTYKQGVRGNVPSERENPSTN